MEMSEKVLRDKMEKELLDATAELARLRNKFLPGRYANISVLESNNLVALPSVIEVLMRLMKDDS